MKITNKIIKSELISWQELKKYEFNQLKDSSNRDITKLKNSIINQGFSFALCNWFEHKFIIDGTGRHLALLELEKEGYEIPDLVVNQIQADNLKEAKKLALMVSSQHGQITQTSLADFTSLDFEIEELKDLQLQELNLPELDLMFNTLEPEETSKEIEEKTIIRVYIDCKGEQEQEKIYNQLLQLGFDPKIQNL
jgi:hypothetical protein